MTKPLPRRPHLRTVPDTIPPTGPSCARCAYGQRLRTARIECRRNPPTPFYAPVIGTSAVWPQTVATDWCAEFKERHDD